LLSEGRSSGEAPDRMSSGGEADAHLYKLDMSSFKARNSAILETLEAQEQERDSLWAALQKAREAGERLREEATKEETKESFKSISEDDDPDPIAAPTSADLMAMLEEEQQQQQRTPPTPPPKQQQQQQQEQEQQQQHKKATVPSRFANRRGAAANQTHQNPRGTPPRQKKASSSNNNATNGSPVLAEGFICPTCWMRAPSAEVLRRHDEEVHQSFIERATNRVLDNTGALGTMTRVASRKIRRSLSLKPQAANDEPVVPMTFRQASYTPGTQPPQRPQRRRASLPPPRMFPVDDPSLLNAASRRYPPPIPESRTTPTSSSPQQPRAVHRSRWKRTTVV